MSNSTIDYKQLMPTDTKSHITEKYESIPVEFNTSLTLHDILQISDDVVQGCFLDDGTYIPEVRTFLLKRSLVNTLTNIELSEDASECYEFLMNSEIAFWLDEKLYELHGSAIEELVEAIDRKLDYMADLGLAAMRDKMNQLIFTIDNFATESSKLFGDISTEDRDKLIASVSSLNTLDEEKLVKAFIKQEKKAKTTKSKRPKVEQNG